MRFSVELPDEELPPEFKPFSHHDEGNDTFTVQWKDDSAIERASVDDKTVTLFHDRCAPRQPVIGMRIESYSNFRHC